jgi:hypothetical protein
VSQFRACIGSPCLRQCVHGASIAAADSQSSAPAPAPPPRVAQGAGAPASVIVDVPMAGLVDAELLSAAAAARPEPEPEPEPALAGQPPVTILSVAEATRRLRSVYRLPCHRRSRVSVGSDAWID